MEYKIIIAEDAYKDLREISAYISKDSKQAATKVIDSIEFKIYQLSKMPERGTRRDELIHGGRMLIAGSYTIYYRIYEKNVRILRVLHHSRNVHSMFE